MSSMMEMESIKIIVRLRSQHASNVVEPYRTQLRVFTGGSSNETEDSARFKVIEDSKKILYKVLNPVAEAHVSAADTHIFKVACCCPEKTTQFEFFNYSGVDRTLDHVLQAISDDKRDKNHLHLLNSCIMACGQTGAGKTYTMFGPGPPMGSQAVLDLPTEEHDQLENEPHSGVDDGLIVRCVEYLFARIAEFERVSSPRASFALKLSCIEVCDEEAFDLFSGSNTLPVHIKEHPLDGFTVQGCQLIDCTNFEVAAAAIELIARHRRGRNSAGSPHSRRHLAADSLHGAHNGAHKVDRSHCIVEICICSPVLAEECTNFPDNEPSTTHHGVHHGRNLQVQTNIYSDLTIDEEPPSAVAARPTILGKITFVDLAGSERLKVSKSEEKSPSGKGKKAAKLKESAQSELGYINPSIYTLGRVIAGLVRAHGSTHNSNVPFQDSVLTKLLIHALSVGYRHQGNLMIACVENSAACELETLRTLKFATSCANMHTPAARLSKQDKLIMDLKSNIKVSNIQI